MKRRTSQEIEEDLAKTLYVRLPCTIKNATQVKELFLGDIKVKMPRQSSRYCHVVFPSIDEKMKNLKNIKKLVIDGKHIIACPPKINPAEEKKKKEKKVRVPKPKPEPKITKTLYISNIKPGTKAQEVKLAFPGCGSVVMLKSKIGKNGRAIIKLGSLQLAGEYLRKEREWPEVRGNKLIINTDTRKKKKTGKMSKSSTLKIYDGENEVSSEKKSKKNNENSSTKPKKQEVESSDYSQEEENEETDEQNSDEDTDVEEE